MITLCKKIFSLSIIFYLLSSFCTRFYEYRNYDITTRSFFSLLPWDEVPLKFIEGKDFVSVQSGILSSCQVAQLLKTNPNTFPNIHPGLNITKENIPDSQKDYVVIRLRATGGSCSFVLKCYFSCFPYAIGKTVYLPYDKDYNYNIILPYPAFLEKNCKDPCEVSLRLSAFL